MKFEKPKIRIVEMCKYIDDNAYSPDLTEDDKNTIFQYLYFIIFSLCTKREYFAFSQDCYNFSIHLAEELYLRIYSSKLDRIKNILDFIKSILYGRMVAWQSNNKFDDIMNAESSRAYKLQLKDAIDNSGSKVVQRLIFGEIDNLPKLIEKVCSLTQFKNDKVVTRNLQMSCLLSLLNWVTLNNDIQQELDEKKYTSMKYNSLLTSSRFKNFDSDVILWHLDDSMENLVRVLLNRIKKYFTENVYEIITKNEVSSSTLDSIVMNKVNYGGEQYSE